MDDRRTLLKEELILVEQIKAQQNMMINALQDLIKDHESRIRLLESNAIRQTELLVSLKELTANQRNYNDDFDRRLNKNERLAFIIIGVGLTFQFLANFTDLMKVVFK